VLLEIDGERVDVDVSLDRFTLREQVAFQRRLGDRFTLREQVAFQRRLGHERYTQWVQAGAPLWEPDVIEALLFVAVKRERPDVDPDNIDIDMATLVESITEGDGGGGENPTSGE